MENKTYGKIIQGVGGLYSVRILDAPDNSLLAGNVVPCRARGSFRHNNLSPLPGDNVVLLPTTQVSEKIEKKSEATDFVIDDIIDRKNSLIRPPMANLDCVFVSLAAAKPMPMPSGEDFVRSGTVNSLKAATPIAILSL